MRLNVFLLQIFVIGILSCENKDRDEIEMLTEHVWVLETEEAIYENLDFMEDMTYKITGLISSPILNDGESVKIATVQGKWSFSNKQITFLTAYVGLISNQTDSLMSTFGGQSIGSFYGHTVDGVFQYSADIDSLFDRGEGTAIENSEFIPTIWTIENLSENSLVVISGSKTIKYNKQ